MEKSTLYDLLSKAILYDWRKVAEKDTIMCFDLRENETETELLKELPEKCKDTLRHYCLAIEERMDFLHYNLQIKIPNLGIQLGMEIQKSFLHTDEG